MLAEEARTPDLLSLTISGSLTVRYVQTVNMMKEMPITDWLSQAVSP